MRREEESESERLCEREESLGIFDPRMWNMSGVKDATRKKRKSGITQTYLIEHIFVMA